MTNLLSRCLWVLLLAACSGESSFSGSSAGSKKPPKDDEPPAPPPAPESEPGSPSEEPTGEATSVDAEGGATSASKPPDKPVPSGSSDPGDKEVQESTPEKPLDVSTTGFACANDMSAAEGPWRGTFSGGPFAGGPVIYTGEVAFDMRRVDDKSLHVEDYRLTGGTFGADQISNAKIDFTLRCNDHNFPEVTLNFTGVMIRSSLGFDSQSWSPPSLSGTWRSRSADFGFQAAEGVWTISRVQ